MSTQFPLNFAPFARPDHMLGTKIGSFAVPTFTQPTMAPDLFETLKASLRHVANSHVPNASASSAPHANPYSAAPDWGAHSNNLLGFLACGQSQPQAPATNHGEQTMTLLPYPYGAGSFEAAMQAAVATRTPQNPAPRFDYNGKTYEVISVTEPTGGMAGAGRTIAYREVATNHGEMTMTLLPYPYGAGSFEAAMQAAVATRTPQNPAPRFTYNGKTYEVISVTEPTGGMTGAGRTIAYREMI